MFFFNTVSVSSPAFIPDEGQDIVPERRVVPLTVSRNIKLTVPWGSGFETAEETAEETDCCWFDAELLWEMPPCEDEAEL